MKYKLSVLMPAKRVALWKRVYDSIKASFSGKWELIIISSFDLPSSLKNKSNINFIKSHRSPLHKQQMGLCQAEGEYITAISDDTIYEPNFLDSSFKILEGKDYKFYLILKYLEGKEFRYPMSNNIDYPWYISNWDFMLSDEYYYQQRHASSNFKYVPYHALVLSNMLITRKLLYLLGGWDCIYHSVPMANNDLAIRMCRYNCKGFIQDGISQKSGWMIGSTEDHSALHRVQIEHDEPLFKEMYNGFSKYWGPGRLMIDINNWKNTKEIWEWRKNEI